MKNMINCDKMISSLAMLFYKELCNIKQTRNDNFTDHVTDEKIKLALKKFTKNDISNHIDINKHKDTIKLFYCNQNHPNYKQEYKAVKNIIRQYIKANDPNKYLRYIIY